MHDVQNSVSSVSMPITLVGVKNIKLPITVQDRTIDGQKTVANIDLAVDLKANLKGTHMSRFVEVISEWDKALSYSTLEDLLARILDRLDASKAFVSMHFTYFVNKKSPTTPAYSLQAYDSFLTGELKKNEHGEAIKDFKLEIHVPVMTVCPCSKAISTEGAHSQRALIKLQVKQNKDYWIEDFIELAEKSGSSPVYPLLKRQDEKFVTEASFANPCFVEDVVRNLAQELEDIEGIESYRVEVESMESIHAHNAYACIDKNKLS